MGARVRSGGVTDTARTLRGEQLSRTGAARSSELIPDRKLSKTLVLRRILNQMGTQEATDR